MTEQDWDNIDKSSRELVKSFLKTIGTESIEDSHGNCSYDLKAKVNGKVILIEVKDRTFPHNRFGDVFAEGIKRQCNNRRIANGEADKCFVVNTFTDNVFCIADINDPRVKVQKKWCNYTTLVDDESHDKVEKTTLSLPQTVKIKYSLDNGSLRFRRLQ